MEACSGGRNWEGFASICNYSRDNIPVPKQFQFQLNVNGCSFEEMWWKKRDFKSFVGSWKKSKTSDISMLIRIQLWQINQFYAQCDDKFTTIYIQLFAFFVRAIVHLKCQYAYAVCNFNSGIYV